MLSSPENHSLQPSHFSEHISPSEFVLTCSPKCLAFACGTYQINDAFAVTGEKVLRKWETRIEKSLFNCSGPRVSVRARWVWACELRGNICMRENEREKFSSIYKLVYLFSHRIKNDAVFAQSICTASLTKL